MHSPAHSRNSRMSMSPSPRPSPRPSPSPRAGLRHPLPTRDNNFQMLEAELASSSSSLDKDNCENPDTKDYWVKKCLELVAAKNAADVRDQRLFNNIFLIYSWKLSSWNIGMQSWRWRTDKFASPKCACKFVSSKRRSTSPICVFFIFYWKLNIPGSWNAFRNWKRTRNSWRWNTNKRRNFWSMILCANSLNWKGNVTNWLPSWARTKASLCQICCRKFANLRQRYKTTIRFSIYLT